MFLANNPDCKTARDIVEMRHIKANLVSMNVDKLVQEGYLERRAVAGDRRKTEAALHRKGTPDHRTGPRGAERLFARLLIMWSRPTRRRFSGPWRSSGKIWTKL